ncbi:hypothetical protein [Kocuria marina]|nr:hypothetical protein [Kocuria indica]
MSDETEVVSLEEYGRRAKLHRGEYIIPNHIMALWAANNQESNDE